MSSSGRVRGTAVVTVILTAALAACDGSSPARSCRVDQDCGAGATCQGGLCQAGLALTLTSPTDGFAANGTVHVQVEVLGRGAAQAEVEILANDTSLGKVTSPFSYDWNTQPFTDGDYAVWARVMTSNREYRTASRTNVVLDRVPPPGPTANASPLTNASPVPVSGTTEPNALVTISEGTALLSQATATASGSWSAALNLEPGVHELLLSATDAAGNTTPASARTALRIEVCRGALTVVSRSPRPGDDDAWARTPIVVRFSNPVKVSTVNDDSVTLTGAGATPLSKTLQLSPDGMELTIVPVQPPSLPNTFVVTLTTAITDLAGNALQLPAEAWTWTVNLWQTLPAPSDLGPWTLGVNKMPPWALAMKVGSDSNPVLAYCVWDLPPTLTRWDGTGWQTVVTLAAGCDPTNAIIVFDIGAAGHYALAWTVNGESRSLYASVIGSSVPTEAPVASGVFDRPDIRFDSAESTFVAWTQDSQLQVSTWNGSSWQRLGTGQLNPESEGAMGPRIWFGADGTPVVSWFAPGEDGSCVGRARNWSGSSWVEFTHWPTDASSDIASGAFAALSTEPIVAYIDRSTTPGQARASLSTATYYGQYRWQPYTGPLNLDPAQAAESIAVAVDPIGAPVVAWTEAVSSGGSQVHVKRWTAAGWATLGTNLGRLGESAGWQAVAVNAEGTIMTWHWSWDAVHRVYSLVLRRYNGQ